MKSKPALLITATIIIMFAVILIAANHLESVKGEQELSKGESVEIIDLQREISGLESRLSHLEHYQRNVELEQSLQAIKMELEQVKELMKSIPSIKTLYGNIIDYEGGEEVLLEIETSGEGERIQVPLAEKASVYMITEISWAPITPEDFIEFLEGSSEHKREFVTLKIIEGKAVQVYQGEKSD